MKKLFMRKKDQATAEQWFNELDQETQQETTIKYLRNLDDKNYNKFLKALVEYRKGDKILAGVDEPDQPNEDLPDLKKRKDDSANDS